MDTYIDYLPTQYEFKIIKDKIDKCDDEYKSVSTKRYRNYDIDGDYYDSLGRNVSKQERKQDTVPWVRVVYIKGKLYIPVNTKYVFKTLGID